MNDPVEFETARDRVVLVLDDDPSVRRGAALALERQGYVVLKAATAREARTVDERWQGPIHVLLCDLVLPDLSGREIANLLQAHRPDMRVLFTSGFCSRGSFRQDMERNSWSFLSKPFDVPALVTAVGLAAAGDAAGAASAAGGG